MSYFDLQVNGYAGIDFNSGFLTTEQARVACEAMLEDGTTGALATVITDSIESMKGKLQRLVRACEEDEVVREVLVGLHIEGPFLNQADGFIGAHPRDWTPARHGGCHEGTAGSGGRSHQNRDPGT